MVCSWLVSGATRLRCRIGTIAWDVWHNGCRERGPAHHQEGGVDGFFVSSQKLLAPSECMSTTKE